MQRRSCLAIVVASALAPDSLWAQAAPRSARVALLVGSPPRNDGGRYLWHQIFVERLRELGWAEGVNLQVQVRYGQGTADGLASAAAEVVALKPDVIVSAGTAPVRAARQATSSIPIVMAGAGDPVGTGLVASLPRPGGNITGVSLMGQEIIPKALSLLREVVPKARRIDLLGNAANPNGNAFFAKIWADAVRTLGIEGQLVEIRGPDDIEPTIAGSRADALLVLPDPTHYVHRERIMAAAIKRRLPLANTQGRDYTLAGSLLSYSVNANDLWSHAAVFADRILRGAKPAETPVEQPTRYELLINQKTARAIGIEVPRAILLRADEVIE